MIFEIGKTYRFDHARKGFFVGRVVSVDSDFLEAEVVDGRAEMAAVSNRIAGAGEVGEVVPLRLSLIRSATEVDQ